MEVPANVELEAGVISGVLTYPETLPEAQVRMSASDFWETIFQVCWDELVEALGEGRSMGLIELNDRVATRLPDRDPEAIQEHFAALSRLQPGRSEVPGLADRVRDLAQRRKVQYAATVVAERAADQRVGLSHLLAELESLEAYDGSQDDATAEELPAVLEQYIAESEEMLDRGEDLTLRTGLDWLDSRLSLRKGGLLLIGAREKTGKSWMVQEIAEGSARRGNRVGWISSEMNYTDISPRILGSLGGQSWVLDRPPTDAEEIQALRKAAQRFQDLPVWFRYESQADLVMRRLNYWVRTHGLDVVIVDYFQDCRLPAEWGDKEHEREARFIVDLHRFAKENGVLMVVVSGVRKGRDEHEAPSVNDLYGSNRIPFTSDWIVLLHRPSPRVQNLVECRLPEARLVRDQVRWWLLRHEVSLAYEEISRRRADELSSTGRDPVQDDQSEAGRHAGGDTLFDGVGQTGGA